jgi:hypothetical protein
LTQVFKFQYLVELVAIKKKKYGGAIENLKKIPTSEVMAEKLI